MFYTFFKWFLGRKYWYHPKDPVQISISVQFQRCILGLLDELLGLEEYVKHESEAG